MKKRILRLVALVLSVCCIAAAFAACDPKPEGPTHVDYVGQLKLDMSSETQKLEVQWGKHSHIDGDTTHFDVPTSFDASGLVKARYLAVDTPESTGHIEEWGKAASRYTEEKLSTAASIMIESDGATWTKDGNGRYLSWVWYKPTADADYRCLNIELLQEGLGASSSASEGRYGTTAVAAIAQASAEKLYMFSGKKDPEFPYGEAASVTVKELRTNVADYLGQRVAVEGIITFNSDYTAYIQDFDAETGMYYGMQVFYGYDSTLIQVLEQGARVRVVGVVGEFYGTYQITDLKYNAFRPKDPANTTKLSTDNEIEYVEITSAQYTGNKTILVGEEEKTYKFTELAVATSVAMKNLKVVDTYTTTKETSDDKGAMTLTCEVDGKTISVRTAVLKDENGKLITEEAYAGKTIDIKGIIEHFEGAYQIKVMSAADINVH